MGPGADDEAGQGQLTDGACDGGSGRLAMFVERIIFEIAAGQHDKILHRQVRAFLVLGLFRYVCTAKWVSE